MKKWILTLGVSAPIVAPVAAIVSCQSNDPKDNKIQQTKDENKALSNKWNVSEDGLYFTKQDFHNGHIFPKNDHVESTAGDDELIAMPRTGRYMSLSNVVELGDKDTFYMVFDNDDQDGTTFDHFEDELFLMDTSYSSGENIDAWNTAVGNELVPSTWGKSLYTAFKNGNSLPWAGSQSNHTNKTFDAAMADLKSQVTEPIYNNIQNYYQTHNKSFMPVYQPEGLFTYTKVADNAYGITFHNKGTSMTAAGFRLKNLNDKTSVEFDTFSIGDKTEWAAYDHNHNSTFFAKKD